MFIAVIYILGIIEFIIVFLLLIPFLFFYLFILLLSLAMWFMGFFFFIFSSDLRGTCHSYLAAVNIKF